MKELYKIKTSNHIFNPLQYADNCYIDPPSLLMKLAPFFTTKEYYFCG
jgi:hypothetical protein